jgi:hypothetical protein
MKKDVLILFFIAMSMNSCSRLEVVYFHGRVTYDCTNKPLSNIQLRISRFFDTGTEDAETVGEVVSDENGYYSLMTEVNQRGALIYYTVEATTHPDVPEGYYGYGMHSHHNEKYDVRIDLKLPARHRYSIRVKNFLPLNNNDNLDQLMVEIPAKQYSQVLVSNLAGTSVDTTINLKFFSSPVYFKYSFTKNGIQTIREDSVFAQDCIETATAGAFY